MQRADFQIQGRPGDSIFVLHPISAEAVDWCDEHLPEAPRWGAGYVIEHRYVSDIIEGLAADGLAGRRV